MGDPRAPTDAALIEAGGTDARAFGELYDRHAEQLYPWARGAG